VLAAIIANNQNVPQPTKLPQIKIDRGGGGQSWPRYEIVDIVAAAATFMEISGEEPAARAARRHRWIGQALPFVKEAREKREAAAFLAGAQVADRAAREEFAAAEKLSIAQMIEIIDEVRGADAPAPALVLRDRGEAAEGADVGGAAIALGLVLGGVAIGIAIARRHRA
jgi:hypothetical protein